MIQIGVQSLVQNQYVGTGIIAGAVTKLNIPFPCNVGIYDKQSRRLVDYVQTDSSGNYSTNIVKTGREYFILAHDHMLTYNAVVQDRVIAV